MYQRLIGELRRYCPQMRVIGWTGTAFRGDGIWLTEHSLFTHIAARITMRELLDHRYLAPLVTAPTETVIDTSDVKVQGGEYVVSSLAAATDRDELVRDACAELVRLAADRRRWLVFAVTVAHAHHLAAELERLGVACAVVSAETPKAERAAHIAAFRAGRLRALVNVAVLTTGFDVPEIDCVALLRATRSPVLYVQIAGRGMRIADVKRNCLWLDFTDTTSRLGPVDQIRGRKRPASTARDGAQEPPHKICDSCGNPSPTAALVCASCGAPFPEPERVTHSTKVSTADVLASTTKWHTVTDVGYRIHDGRDGKPDSLRVDYRSGLRVAASEWVCLNHPLGSFPRRKAEVWWSQRGSEPVPGDVDQAYERRSELARPSKVCVQPDGQFSRIVSYEWARQEVAA